MTQKKIFFKKLTECLNNLGSYDISSAMPLFYVMVAKHQGLLSERRLPMFKESGQHNLVELIDGIESKLLKDIRDVIDNHYFEGRSAEIIVRFYEICSQGIQDNYHEIIEYIISYYSIRGGRYAGMNVTPKEIAKLMAGIIAKQNPNCIYDPCAGLCTFSILPELHNVPFIGQELNVITKIIADVRFESVRKKALLYREDSMIVWRSEDGCDLLASELPLGIRFNDVSRNKKSPKLLEDKVIHEFAKSSTLKKAVLMVSPSTCFRKENSALRRMLSENNWIEGVVKMPSAILPYTGIAPVIIILNKERTIRSVRFVLSEDCFFSEGKSKILDYQSVLDRLYGKDEKQSATVEVNTISEHDFILDPSIFIREKNRCAAWPEIGGIR